MRLPGLNEMIDARIKTGRHSKHGKRWNSYSDLKRKYQGYIAGYAEVQGVRVGQYDRHFNYLLIERERRRDPSNILCGASKLVEDALQQCGRLAGDGWASVDGITSYHLHEPTIDGVFVLFQACPVLSLSALTDAFQEASAKGFKNG